MDIEEQERIEAVNRYIRGDKPANIYGEMNRSETWLFKWVKRFKSGDREWYKTQSRAPNNPGRATCEDIERAVVNTRIALMAGNEHESKYLGVGADSIQHRMHQLGFSDDVIPAISTIKRIVKRHNLKVNRRERYKRVKSKKRYALLNPTQIGEMHQIDFVGPRFIKGYGAISSLNLIDVVCNQVHIEQYNSRIMDNVIGFLIRYWNNDRIPRYLQVDNGMYFIGGFKYPRKFSRFIRLCLYVGIELVFIAPRSTWMNGSIENFNNWFGDKFWEKEDFTSLEDIRTKSLHFIDQYNALSAWNKRDKRLTQINPAKMLNDDVKINLDKLPLTKGKIHFIRKVDNEGRISILNKVFFLSEEFIGEYVWTTIDMTQQRMKVSYQAKDQDTAALIKNLAYTIDEKIHSHIPNIWKS
jgi:transposase InsO family protein